MKNMIVRDQQTVGGFQQMMFAALAKRQLQGTAFGKHGHTGTQQGLKKQSQIITPIDPKNDKQSGTGCTAEWFSGNKTRAGRPPGKTGVSSFQWYRRVVGPQQCESKVMNGNREVGLQSSRRCSRKAVLGMRDCSQHQQGNGRRSRGTLVELLPEETPVLPCDR